MQSWIDERYGDHDLFDFYAANVAEREDEVAAYVENIGLEMPVLLVSQEIDNQYMIRGNASPYPLDYIIDGNGIIQYAHHEYEPELILMTLDRLLDLEENKPALRMETDSLDFGEVEIGNFRNRDIILWNEGSAELRIGEIRLDNGYFSIEIFGEPTLPAGDTTLISLVFSPSDSNAVGLIHGHATFQTNDPDYAEVSIELTGRGVLPGETQPDGFAPMVFNVAEAYPNPFNEITVIRYELPHATMVKISISDITGRNVFSTSNEWREAGTHVQNWTASGLSNGIYVLCVQAGHHGATQKIVLIR